MKHSKDHEESSSSSSSSSSSKKKAETPVSYDPQGPPPPGGYQMPLPNAYAPPPPGNGQTVQIVMQQTTMQSGLLQPPAFFNVEVDRQKHCCRKCCKCCTKCMKNCCVAGTKTRYYSTTQFIVAYDATVQTLIDAVNQEFGENYDTAYLGAYRLINTERLAPIVGNIGTYTQLRIHLRNGLACC